MNQALEGRCRTFLAHDEAPGVLQPDVRTFNDPATAVTPHPATILVGRFPIVWSPGDHRFDSPFGQHRPRGIGIIPPVRNQTPGYSALDRSQERSLPPGTQRPGEVRAEYPGHQPIP
jgi:hypothetical protein